MNPSADDEDRLFDDILWVPMGHRLRWLLAACSTLSAVAHVPVVAEHLREAPYMGEEFIVLIIGCLLIALAALIADTAAVYLMAAVTCGLAIIGYILTRIIAFPALADDVGNWFEPLGVVAIVAESVTVTVAVAALTSRHRQPVSGTSCSALIREAASSTNASRSGQWR